MLYGETVTQRIPAGASAWFRTTLSWDNVVLKASELSALTLNLYSSRTGTVVNSRTDVDVKNKLDEAGHFAFELLPADTAPLAGGELTLRLTATWANPATRGAPYVFFLGLDEVSAPVVAP